jgi:transcriptional regulator GlxA family with amidase domain
MRLEKPKQSSAVPPRDEAVERAIALMRDGLQLTWTVTSLARRVGVSRPVLARRFRENQGVSPMRYLTRCRLEQAKVLLAQTALSLAQVAASVGYSSEFAFNRAFKREHFVAPGTFRKQVLGGAPQFRLAA